MLQRGKVTGVAEIGVRPEREGGELGHGLGGAPYADAVIGRRGAIFIPGFPRVI